MKKSIIVLALLLIVSACERKETEVNFNKIYVTIYPIEYVVDYLVGESVEVKSIIPLGGDAHTYVPTQKQMNSIIESDMFIYLGLGLEESAAAIEEAIKNENLVSLEVGNVLDLETVSYQDDEEHDEHEEHEDHNHDTNDNHHIWIDPEYMIDISKVVKDDLISVYPELEEEINRNLEHLINQFKSIDKLYHSHLSDTEIDTFIVTHDAFRHLEKYGVHSLAIKDEAHSKDPTQKEINAIIEDAKELGIKHVVYEQNIPCLPADIIRNQISGEKVILHNLSVRTKTDVKNDKNLIDLMKDNLEILNTILN